MVKAMGAGPGHREIEPARRQAAAVHGQVAHGPGANRGRDAGAEQIAATVLFLVEGPDYVTGQIIAVDGGRSVQQ